MTLRRAFALLLVPALAWAATPPAQPAAVERCVEAALASNLALQREGLDLDTARARLDSARSLLFPRLDLDARYTLSNGGRTIDIPAGDLVNPAYATLNQLLGERRFGEVQNQAIRLLRPHEQETKLRLTQPLYRPEISRGVEAARATVAAREAARAAYRRELRLEVERACHRLVQVRRSVAILESAQGLVEESLRANRSLVANGAATEDAALRAAAEVGEVRQQLEAARADADQARAWVNFLLNKPADAEVEDVGGAELSGFGKAVGAYLAEAQGEKGRVREEIEALEHALRAAEAGERAVRAARAPSLSLAAESGIQGDRYSFGRDERYSQVHLVAAWNLLDWGANRARAREAANERRRTASQAEEMGRLVSVQERNARLRLQAAGASLKAAEMRVEAARAAFAVVRRRAQEGLVNQLGFMDARHTLTAAELGLAAAEAALAVAYAEFNRALALEPAAGKRG